jgi:hypothetical protein
MSFPKYNTDNGLHIMHCGAASLPSKNVTTQFCLTHLKSLNKHTHARTRYIQPEVISTACDCNAQAGEESAANC